MQFARLRLVLPLIACVLASSDAAEVQETGQEGIFYGRKVQPFACSGYWRRLLLPGPA